MKYSAEEFSLAGDRFLGQPYSKMDCQTFVENAMRQIGLDMNLKGSNAWYREVRKNGWVGSPEECKKKFGSVPKGALLFIHAFDGGEEKVGYHDGLGNASHIGTKTGRTGADMVRRATEAGASNAGKFNFGDGAIHSSSTREHVATSKFADRTISGGWNCVGLYKKFSYGEAIDKILDGSSPAPSPDPEPSPEPTPATKTMYVTTPDGKSANIRRKASKQSALVEHVPYGASVTWTKNNGKGWAYVKYHGFVGWMMEDFLTEDVPGPAPSPEPDPEPVPDPDPPILIEDATVWSENGKPVHMRAQPTTSCKLYDDVPVGAMVCVDAYNCVTDSKGNQWTKVSYGRRKGWYIMTKFLSLG